MPKKSPFTQDQAALLEARLPEFVETVNKWDPLWKGNSKGVSVWLKNTVAELLDEPAFATFEPGFPSKQKMVEAMKRKYNNHFNYTMCVKGEGKTKLGDNIGGSVNPTSQAYRRTSLVSFSNTITPRDLFISENEEEIKARYQKISKETGIPGGGARQAAIHMMWEEADHEEWEEKARSYVYNIEENRKEFAELARASIENLLESRQLGSFAVTLAWAGRGNDNVIEAGKIHSAYDAPKGELIAGFAFEDDNESNARWYAVADQVLPRHGVSVGTKFERMDNGFPQFPTLDLENMTSRAVLPVLKDYFLVVWDHSQGGSTTIPWDDIEKYPQDYYDDTTYVFPIRLKCPSAVPSKDILPVAWYLMELPPDKQFKFYSKKDVDFNIEFRKNLESPPSNNNQQNTVDKDKDVSSVSDEEVDGGSSEDENPADEELDGVFVVDDSDENDDELEYEDLDGNTSGDEESSNDGCLSDPPTMADEIPSGSPPLPVPPKTPSQPMRNSLASRSPPLAVPPTTPSQPLQNSLKNGEVIPPLPEDRRSAHRTPLKIKVPPSSSKPQTTASSEKTSAVIPAPDKRPPAEAKKRGRPRKSKPNSQTNPTISAPASSDISPVVNNINSAPAPAPGAALVVHTADPDPPAPVEKSEPRRGGRKRTLATMGPVLASDPTKPPAKRQKLQDRWTYIAKSPVKK